MKEHVYLVSLYIGTEDYESLKNYAYKDYSRAVGKFDMIVKGLQKPDKCWVGDFAMTNGEPTKNFILCEKRYNGTEENLFWELTNKIDDNYKVYLHLWKMEVR